MGADSELLIALKTAAHAEGFPLVGAVDLESVLEGQAFSQAVSTYDRWIDSKHQGAMEYLVRGRDRRADPRIVLPGAQSILCVALPYSTLPAGASDASTGVRYARYIRGRDYHHEIAERLERVMRQAQSQVTNAEQLKWKVCVDTSAVLERFWAAMCGLGWIGKNTMLIHPKLGSYLLLGSVLIDQKLGKRPEPILDLCGHCTRCLNACPTGAFVAPKTLDSNRCVSYWTLEKRGSLELTPEQRAKTGNWVAGCDLCQEACPFNSKPSKAEQQGTTSQNIEDGATSLNHWIELLDETTEDYKRRIADSALSRVKPAQFSRNLAVALSNSLDSFTSKGLLSRIEKRLKSETDDVARQEWKKCLETAQLVLPTTIP